MATIFEAREVLLLASGANKTRAAAHQGEILEAVPASMLRRHPNASFLFDQQAATALSLSDEWIRKPPKAL